MTSSSGAEVLAPPQRPQVPARGVADEDNVTAMPPVAPVGAPLGHVRFSPE